jgi:hypothetical protein
MRDGLFTSPILGINDMDCIWDLNNLYGTLRYTIDEMLCNALVSDKDINMNSMHVDNMWEHSQNIRQRVHMLRDKNNELSKVILISTLSNLIGEFNRSSFRLFEDVREPPAVGQIPSTEFTKLVDVFQGHQNTMKIIEDYLLNISSYGIQNVDRRQCEIYIKHGLRLIKPVCTGSEYILDALIGTILYTARRLATRTACIKGICKRRNMLLDQISEMHTEVGTCADIPDERRIDSSFTSSDAIKIRRLHRSVLGIHFASMSMIPSVDLPLGGDNRYSWEPKYQQYQRILMGACRQLDGFILDTTTYDERMHAMWHAP